MSNLKDIQSGVKLMQELTETLQREFGHIYTGKNLIANNVSYPSLPDETIKVRDGVKSVLEGAMLIYLLAMWESHMPKNVHEWLTADQKQKLNAFKHVRDSAAHKYKGERAKKHKSKVKAFESEMPFSNIEWDRTSDTINLSKSNVSYEFHQFMNSLIQCLLVRFHENRKPNT